MNADRSASLVGRWVSLYTRGLPSEIRQSRRDEIDDDLWCQLSEAASSGRTDRSLADEIVARFVLGIPADITWRLDQIRVARRRGTPARRLTMHAPGRALLAILGGVGWLIWPLPQAYVGREWPTEGMLPWLLMLSVIGGTWAMAGATAGLAFGVQDKIRPGVAVVVSIGALVGALSVMGAYAAIFALPVGSAVLLWELGRIGAVGVGLSRIHIASAVLAMVPIAAILANPVIFDDRVQSMALFALVMPYAFSWIAIGWSLWRGASIPERTPTAA